LLESLFSYHDWVAPSASLVTIVASLVPFIQKALQYRRDKVAIQLWENRATFDDKLIERLSLLLGQAADAHTEPETRQMLNKEIDKLINESIHAPGH